MASAHERTEKPSPKRLRDARRKGQIARSRDLALAGAAVAGTMALAVFGGRLMDGLGARMAADLASVGDEPLRTLAAGEVNGLVMRSGWLIAVLVGPIAVCTMAAGVIVHGFQGGWSFAPEALQLRWSRLNPANGVKRFGLLQSGADTVKTIVSVAAVAWLSWLATEAVIHDSVRLPWMTPVAAARVGWDHIERLLWQTSVVLGLLALGDYGLQRYRLMQSLRMSRQELRDEAKEQEGNAEVKGRIRRIQREMSRRRMIADVRRATVVITNPTHFAVALEYRRGAMAAPVVLAKGQDLIAAAIREQARKHGIPIVENKPLAQALFKSTEVGQAIPAGLFAAVAEVLAQLIRMKQLVL